MLLLALPVGVAIGLSLGALGGGGSILTVPALVYLLGQSPHGATTTSLVIVGVTALAGMAAHLRAGNVRLGWGLAFGMLGIGGSYAGSRLSASVQPDVLLAAFSALMLLAAGAMLRRARRTSTPLPGRLPVAAGPVVTDRAAPPGDEAAETPRATWWRVLVAATTVGVVTGFFGVGGGFVVVPALVLGLGLPMAPAVGTSLLVITINSASALGFRLGSHPHLDPVLVATFTAAAVVGTLGGAAVSARVRPQRLIGAFAVLLVAVASYTASRSLPHVL